jgi:hypothetical protein
MQQRTFAAVLLVTSIWTSYAPYVKAASSKSTTVSQSTAALERNKKLLQDAVNHLHDKSKWSAQILKSTPNPQAKAFLAYLYFTNRVPVPNKRQTVQRLMKQVVKAAQEEYAGVELDVSEETDFNNLHSILRAMRFINEGDEDRIRIPTFIFQTYPTEAYDAFASYWGSSRDGFSNVDWNSDIEKVPAANRFIGIMRDLWGHPNPSCVGTLMNASYRSQAEVIMEASISPQQFKPSKHSKSTQETVRKNDLYLQQWSNKEVWNKVSYERLLAEHKKAVEEVSNYYQQKFKLDTNMAKACASSAIDTIENVFMSASPDKEDDATVKLKTLVSGSNTTAKQLDECLASRKPGEEELRDLLTHSILNHGCIDVIKWLIDHGAPLKGGRETALFSAVRRPEVVELLLNKGAAVDEPNKLGKTALFQALQFNCAKTVELLCAAGADVKHAMLPPTDTDPNVFNIDACDYYYTVGGRTPLMYAAAFSSYSLMKYMLEKGVDKTAKDSEGATAGKFLADNKLLSAKERAELLAILPFKQSGTAITK